MEIDKALGTVVRTIRLNGRELKLSPLTLKDHAEFANHIRNKRIKEFSEMAQGMSDAVKAQNIREIQKESMLDAVASMEGMLYLFWLAVKRHQPGISLEEVGEIIGQNDIEKVLGIITEVDLDIESNPQTAEEGNL